MIEIIERDLFIDEANNDGYRPFVPICCAKETMGKSQAGEFCADLNVFHFEKLN